MVRSNLSIFKRMILVNSGSYATMIQTTKTKITVQNVQWRLLMLLTTNQWEKMVLSNFTLDMPWQRLRETLKRRKTLSDTKHPRRDAIYTSKISQPLGPKKISDNNSKSLDQLKRSDLKIKANLLTLLLLSVSRHLMLPLQLNKHYTTKHSMIRHSLLIIMRSKNSDKFKKKKPLIKLISKDISSNKLVDSTWMTLQATLTLLKSYNN